MDFSWIVQVVGKVFDFSKRMMGGLQALMPLWWAGEIMVTVFFFVVLCLLVVWDCICHDILYGRSLKLGAHKPSPSYKTTSYGT